MQTCSLCNSLSPDSAMHCQNCKADLSEFSTAVTARRRFQDNSRIKYIRIMVADNCCPACRNAEGAYAKDAVPQLPVDGCSSANGCRCFYQPFLEELYP